MGCGSSVPQSQMQADAVVNIVGTKAKVEVVENVPLPKEKVQENESVPDNVIRVQPSIKVKAQEVEAITNEVPAPQARVSAERSASVPTAWGSSGPQDVLKVLMDGNKRFLAGTSIHPHQDLQRVQAISAKQFPIAAVLGCADSRVPAEIVFDAGFGDIFVCRIAGNIATAEEVASLEYAVLDLGVKLIMVLGHTQCGAVKAAMSGKPFPGFIDTLVGQLDVAIERSKQSYHQNVHISEEESHKDHVDHVVKENVLYQITRCKRSGIISTGIEEGTLRVVGGVYNLATGEVELVS